MPEIDFSAIGLKELACLISEILRSNGIDATLVGGACVSIYSENRYQSFDLDFVTYEGLKKVESVLSKFGFKRQGRSFVHQNCLYLIDFVNPPIAIAGDAVQSFGNLKTAAGSLQLLLPIDCVKDRLAAYFYWNDAQAFEQAVLVATKQNIDCSILRRWAEKEGFLEKFKDFLAACIPK